MPTGHACDIGFCEGVVDPVARMREESLIVYLSVARRRLALAICAFAVLKSSTKVPNMALGRPQRAYSPPYGLGSRLQIEIYNHRVNIHTSGKAEEPVGRVAMA